MLPIRSVTREAETAASALTRLAPHPHGTPVWADYHLRFLERYGIGALVPVAQLLDPDTGLGFPAGYRGSRLQSPQHGLSERDTRLLALAQEATMDQRSEVCLDDQTISELSGPDTATQTQAHTELSFRLQAPTRIAVDRGEFVLAVVGVSRAAGTMTGRFLELLDLADRERMSAAYVQLPTVTEEALPAQVSCPPLSPRVENVTRSPATWSHVISLAEHRTPDNNVIGLDDLAVTGDAGQLHLMSLSRHQPVEPTVFNSVELTNHVHPLVRFLAEINTARVAACGPFSWGAATHLPFLPRGRYRRTILSPAQWKLFPSDLPGSRAPWSQ